MLSPDQVKELKREDYTKYSLIIDWDGSGMDSCTRIYMYTSDPVRTSDEIRQAFMGGSTLVLEDVLDIDFTPCELLVRTGNAICFLFHQVDDD